MATPRSERFAVTPGSGRSLSITPGSRVLRSPLSDETIWRRLKEAGFDEETIRRRDKAALIAYIAKLEAEIFDHQHQMGLLIMEKKELTLKYEQTKASTETAEILAKRDQASHLSAMTEARKREEKLKKTIGVKDECIASVEKALHELRAECAETKIAAESKLGEAKRLAEEAQTKYVAAEAKLLSAESLNLEATRYRSVAERKLQEVAAREDDLRRRIETFKSDCDEKEREISLERQSLSERKNSLQQEHDRLLEAQALLNQREDFIFSRSEKLDQLEKELEDMKLSIKEENRIINDEKSKLELGEVSLKKRAEILSKREALLSDKERELLLSQEKLASKESNEINKVIANHEFDLRARKSAFEAELEAKVKEVEHDLETKRRAWELKEVDLSQREDIVKEKEQDLEVQSRVLSEREKEVAEISCALDDKEKKFRDSEHDIELTKIILQREREEIVSMKNDLNESLNSLEERRKELDSAKEKFEALKTETSELSFLEMKLKEEIDSVRAQQQELVSEADRLTLEKSKFEAEWESIDEKREELRKEAERLEEERSAFSKFIKDEYDSLRREKDEMRDQYKRDSESLCLERESFMNKMVEERSDWFSKMQQERADFLLDVETRRKDLENCIDKKCEELESSLREKEIAFEQEKNNELHHINSLKEKVSKEMEMVGLEMKRLETERVEINLEREQRNREWTELTNAIEELGIQREKLKEQRELLHVDREDINAQIEELNKLESVKLALENTAYAKQLQSEAVARNKKIYRKKNPERSNNITSDVSDLQIENNKGPDNLGNGSASRVSWIKRCSEMIFRKSPEKPPLKYGENSLTLNEEDANFSGDNGRELMKEKTFESIFGESKEILEVSPMDLIERTGEKSSSSSEQDSRPNRKRTAVSVSDDELDQRKNKQKISHQHEESEISLEQITLHGTLPDQHDGCDDQNPSISAEEIKEGDGETTVLVVDKIISVSEVICELETDDIDTNLQDTLELERFVADLDMGIIADEVKQCEEKGITIESTQESLREEDGK